MVFNTKRRQSRDDTPFSRNHGEFGLKTKKFSQISELTSSNTNPSRIRITRAGVVHENKILTFHVINNNMRSIIRNKN